MLQINTLGYDTRDLCVLTSIQKLVINSMLHNQKLRNNTNDVEGITKIKNRKYASFTNKEADFV